MVVIIINNDRQGLTNVTVFIEHKIPQEPVHLNFIE